jgi:hypothetical protein
MGCGWNGGKAGLVSEAAGGRQWAVVAAFSENFRESGDDFTSKSRDPVLGRRQMVLRPSHLLDLAENLIRLLDVEDAANKVRIPGRFGPHPEEYHNEIYRRLMAETDGLPAGTEFKKALLKELKRLAKDARTPGTKLNDLLTGG